MRRLCGYGDEKRYRLNKPTSITTGVEIVNGGGGDQALQRAIVFRKLGYPSGVLIDNDDSEIKERVAEAEQAGVDVVRWSSGRAIEDEFVHGLSDTGLRKFVAMGIENREEESIRAQVAVHLGRQSSELGGVDPFGWVEEGEESALREALAAAAKGLKAKREESTKPRREERSAWFKREDHGERLAELWREHHDDFQTGSPLPEVLKQVKTFIYDD